jgi:gustatory receptor
MRELRERIFSILNEEKDLDMDMELEVFTHALNYFPSSFFYGNFSLLPTCAYKAVAFLQDISEERVRLSAAGLFSVGMNVVPSVSCFIFISSLTSSVPSVQFYLFIAFS